METFFGSTYTVQADSDRMGIRFKGDKIEHKGAADIISDGIPFGAVQVPSSGEPIVMMAERQTTGGYTKIATVIRADLWRLAQVQPGTTVRFRQVSAEEALSSYREVWGFLTTPSQ
jgi:antagonist of KipI